MDTMTAPTETSTLAVYAWQAELHRFNCALWGGDKPYSWSAPCGCPRASGWTSDEG